MEKFHRIFCAGWLIALALLATPSEARAELTAFISPFGVSSITGGTGSAGLAIATYHDKIRAEWISLEGLASYTDSHSSGFAVSSAMIWSLNSSLGVGARVGLLGENNLEEGFAAFVMRLKPLNSPFFVEPNIGQAGAGGFYSRIAFGYSFF